MLVFKEKILVKLETRPLFSHRFPRRKYLCMVGLKPYEDGQVVERLKKPERKNGIFTLGLEIKPNGNSSSEQLRRWLFYDPVTRRCIEGAANSLHLTCNTFQIHRFWAFFSIFPTVVNDERLSNNTSQQALKLSLLQHTTTERPR